MEVLFGGGQVFGGVVDCNHPGLEAIRKTTECDFVGEMVQQKEQVERVIDEMAIRRDSAGLDDLCSHETKGDTDTKRKGRSSLVEARISLHV